MIASEASAIRERRTEWSRRARFDEIRREVAGRVSRVSGEMTEHEIDALIRRMTLVQLKYELDDCARMA